MSIKAKSPPIDPETKARQEAAEKRADASRIDETQDNLSQDTRAVIRNFGRFVGGSRLGGLSLVTATRAPAINGAPLRGSSLLTALRSGSLAR